MLTIVEKENENEDDKENDNKKDNDIDKDVENWFFPFSLEIASEYGWC